MRTDLFPGTGTFYGFGGIRPGQQGRGTEPGAGAPGSSVILSPPGPSHGSEGAHRVDVVQRFLGQCGQAGPGPAAKGREAPNVPDRKRRGPQPIPTIGIDPESGELRTRKKKCCGFAMLMALVPGSPGVLCTDQGTGGAQIRRWRGSAYTGNLSTRGLLCSSSLTGAGRHKNVAARRRSLPRQNERTGRHINTARSRWPSQASDVVIIGLRPPSSRLPCILDMENANGLERTSLGCDNKNREQ